MPEKPTPEEGDQSSLKTVLMNKYRDLLLDRITKEDLEELRYYLSRQYDEKHGWNDECRRRFEQKLQMFMHEEIMRREIAGIETLLPLLTHEDVRKKKANNVSG
jgi:hypothetical protein